MSLSKCQLCSQLLGCTEKWCHLILYVPWWNGVKRMYRVGAEQNYSRVEGSWQQSGGTTLVSALALCLNLLSHVWLHISGGWNCCQKIRRGVVYRLIGVKMDIKDINDFNLWTKELGCNYWSTYTKSGIGGVPVTSLHRDPIGVDNGSLGAKN